VRQSIANRGGGALHLRQPDYNRKEKFCSRLAADAANEISRLAFGLQLTRSGLFPHRTDFA